MARGRIQLRDVVVAGSSAWVVAFTALALKAANASWGVTAGVIIAVALAMFVAALFIAARRRSRLGLAERTAQQILSSGITPRTARAEAAPEPAAPGEFSELFRALGELRGRIEVQLREVAKKSKNLESIIRAMDEPLLATDSSQSVLLCNQSAEAVFGAEPGGLAGRRIDDLLTQAELLEMHEAARSGQARRARVRVTTPLGQRVMQASAVPVPMAWGDGIFGAVMVLRDVTELDQAMQVKTDFVANASHELRTPVAAIKASAETLGDVAADDPEMAAKLGGIIMSHATRLEELLRDLLDLSRLESPDVPLEITPLNLAQLERALTSMFEPVCRERGLELSFELDPALADARTDSRLLMLVLRNFVENATKFAFEGTRVRIVGAAVRDPAVAPPPVLSPVGARAGRPNPPRHAGEDAASPPVMARFEIIDRGVGIPLQHQERVFERFFQVDSARTSTSSAATRGTGLGLAIAKHAAKALGGRCGLSSVWGEGTTAWVEIPFSPRPA